MGKIRTAITRVDLNQRSFQKKHFEPTLINFIYGTNGTGKTTISETFQDETKSALTIDSLAKDDLILVYNNSYIQQEVQNYGNMPGVFTLSKQNADIKRQIDEAHALRHVIIQKQRKMSSSKSQQNKNLIMKSGDPQSYYEKRNIQLLNRAINRTSANLPKSF